MRWILVLAAATLGLSGVVALQSVATDGARAESRPVLADNQGPGAQP